MEELVVLLMGHSTDQWKQVVVVGQKEHPQVDEGEDTCIFR